MKIRGENCISFTSLKHRGLPLIGSDLKTIKCQQFFTFQNKIFPTYC